MTSREPRRFDRALFLRRLILAELLARRGEGPLALRPPRQFRSAPREPERKQEAEP